MNKVKGFTLIELMIVIAIIAIIAAIAIPGLLSSQRASNERNASGSMKTIGTAEADFRSNDRDANLTNDFWVGDVQGLYAIEGPDGAGIKLIEVTIARADDDIDASGESYAAVPAFAPKAGYRYEVLTTYEDSAAASIAYETVAGSGRNNSRFGFETRPDSYGSSGKLNFILSEENTMFKQDFGSITVNTEFPFDPTATANGWAPMD